MSAHSQKGNISDGLSKSGKHGAIIKLSLSFSLKPERKQRGNQVSVKERMLESSMFFDCQ